MLTEIHHFCSNKLLEGDLSTRVCSEACLGILTGNGPSNDPAIAPKTQNTFPRPALRRHANGNSNDASGKPTKERYKQQSTCSIALASEAARQRDVAPYKSPGYSRSAAAQFKPPIKPRTRKHPTINSTIPTRVTSGIESETSSTKSTLDQLSTDKPSDDFDGMDVESLSSLGASSDEQNEDQDVPNHVSNVGESEHEPSNMSTSKLQKRKRRKFYFSQTADLALLKEMLAVESTENRFFIFIGSGTESSVFFFPVLTTGKRQHRRPTNEPGQPAAPERQLKVEPSLE
ncbi:hypothetical protein DVH05_018243 [Phytophthora capsici]|nr:hypothetical protein DVH05_018243 [Phytophthora capsici]